MKKLILILSTFISIQYAHSQSIGIGANTTPDPSAVLDVNGTTKGFLPPRMNNVQRGAIPSPAPGLMVFQTNTIVSPASNAGLYVNLANGWKRIATSDEIVAGTNSWVVSGVNQYSGVTGNVGIGTSTPSDKLDVRGYFRVSFDNDYIKLSSDFLGERLEFFEAGVEKASIFHSQGGIGFSTQGNVSHLRLFSSGNITTSSGSSFDIDGHTNTKATLTIDDDTPEIEFRDGAEVQASIKRNGASLHIGNNTTLGGLSFRTQDILRAQLESDGDFGINIPIANEKLHVGGNGLFTGNISADGNVNSNSTMSINDPSGTLYLKNASVDKGFFQLSGENVRIGTVSANNTGDFIIRTNGADQVSVDESGNTTTKRLVVNQNLEAIKINGDDPAINFFESNIQKGYLWMINNDMNIGTSNITGRINMATSQVTIGTSIATPSTYKLGVGGRIICEELKVKLQSAGWPDYVFAKNYKLKPLEEVENFIKINKHLPNIPSAQVIDKEGLEVGEMQRRMMEKIEELTLYIIDLKKEVDTLKANKQ
jgi:hypothetical protein